MTEEQEYQEYLNGEHWTAGKLSVGDFCYVEQIKRVENGNIELRQAFAGERGFLFHISDYEYVCIVIDKEAAKKMMLVLKDKVDYFVDENVTGIRFPVEELAPGPNAWNIVYETIKPLLDVDEAVKQANKFSDWLKYVPPLVIQNASMPENGHEPNIVWQ